MRHSSHAPLVGALTLALAAALAPSSAHAITGDSPCTGPVVRPSPSFPNLCALFPQLCNGSGDVPFRVVGDGLIGVSQTIRGLASGSLTTNIARDQIVNMARSDLFVLAVPQQVRATAVNQIVTVCNTMLPGVRAGNVSAGAFMAAFSGAYLGAARQGALSQSYANSQADTVTTTTTGGWSINFGIFTIFENQTVTTVQDTPSEGAGYTSECDSNGDCVCVPE